MTSQTCTRCATEREFDGFARDARRPNGVRSICKQCEKLAARDRRRGKAKPTALILAPNFPAPPPALEVVREIEVDDRHGAARREVEVTLSNLHPPIGPTDAAMVQQARSLADLYDREYWGDDATRACASLSVRITAALVQLKATRASASEAKPAPARKSAASY